MKKAMIYYKSRTGITRRLGERIMEFLDGQNVKTDFKSIEEYDPSDLEGVDYLFLGCWTGGLMVLFQGPERSWIEFAKKLPGELNKTKIILFTTYKLLTGSMFRNMQKHLLSSSGSEPLPVIKSRNGNLTEEGRILLDTIMEDQKD